MTTNNFSIFPFTLASDRTLPEGVTALNMEWTLLPSESHIPDEAAKSIRNCLGCQNKITRLNLSGIRGIMSSNDSCEEKFMGLKDQGMI